MCERAAALRASSKDINTSPSGVRGRGAGWTDALLPGSVRPALALARGCEPLVQGRGVAATFVRQQLGLSWKGLDEANSAVDANNAGELEGRASGGPPSGSGTLARRKLGDGSSSGSSDDMPRTCAQVFAETVVQGLCSATANYHNGIASVSNII